MTMQQEQHEQQRITKGGPQSPPAGAEGSQIEQVAGVEGGPSAAEPTEAMRDGIRKRPVIGAALAGGAVLGAATLVGVLETAVGMGAAYVAYRMIKRRRKAE